ncbi:MAG: GGDEF domain-containing protein [Burkholderiales bacterium]|nr:GGDEF domain-containing protein [Burkholderiales bacterium]
MPPPTEPAAASADARFLEFRTFSIRLGLMVAAVPAVALLLHWYLRHDLDRHALLAGAGSTLALLIYPLAIVFGAPRRWLPWCMVGGLASFMLLIIWGLSYLPDGYHDSLWLLLYPMLFGPLLGMPFGLRENAEKLVLLLLIPVLAARAIPAFPLLQFYVMVLPALMVSVYFKGMVDRIIEANHAYRQQIEALANRDALTGCFNRRYFMEQATRLLKQGQRSGLPTSLLMLDIDHFKSVNDRYGHAAGDLALRAVAQRLGATLRETDLAARIGGEEFVVLLPDTAREPALTAAERLRLAIQDAGVSVPGLPEPLRVSASLGVALTLADGDTLDALLERADQALYAAKRGGRNRVESG